MASTDIPKGQHASDSGCSSSPQEVRRFNGFMANLTTRELFRGAIRLDVEPKVFQMLALLLRVADFSVQRMRSRVIVGTTSKPESVACALRFTYAIDGS
jgi:hypothetical protein